MGILWLWGRMHSRAHPPPELHRALPCPRGAPLLELQLLLGRAPLGPPQARGDGHGSRELLPERVALDLHPEVLVLELRVGLPAREQVPEEPWPQLLPPS